MNYLKNPPLGQKRHINYIFIYSEIKYTEVK